jgi:tetratricopeptide (TPR) repeat protein
MVAAEHPGSYAVQLALGLALQSGGDTDGAIVAFEKAVTLLPMATGKDSARSLLARALIQKGNPARAMQVLADLLERDHTDIDAARQLAKLADAAADAPRRWLAYERIVELDPFDAGAHVALGRMALEKKNAEVAVREHRAALASNPIDVAAAHCDLGESYLLAGRKADAKKHVMAALEIAPLYDRAQDLLLKIVEGRQ